MKILDQEILNLSPPSSKFEKKNSHSSKLYVKNYFMTHLEGKPPLHVV